MLRSLSIAGRSGLLLSAASGLFGCTPPSSSPLESSASPSTVESPLEFAGCASVLAGPRCMLGPHRSVRVWAPAAVELSARSVPAAELAMQRVQVGSGTRHEVVLPPGARALELIDRRGRLCLRLQLLEPDAAPVLDRARALRAQGEFAVARALLDDARPQLAEAQRVRADALRARLLLSEGDHAGAVAGLRDSMSAAQRLGRVSDAVQDAAALAYVLTMTVRDYAAARGVLEQASSLAVEDPGSRAILPHYFGLLALETGDIRGALEAFREAVARSERLGLRDHELPAREAYASTLARLGRHVEAVEAQERVAAEFVSPDPCLQADRFEAIAWFTLEAEAAPESELGRKGRAASQRSGQLLERCKRPWNLRNHRINASLLALADGDAAQASALLQELPALAGDHPLLQVWELEARGRLGLLRRDWASALRSFDQARVAAERAGLWDSVHLAWLGRARAFAGAGRSEAALRSYISARDVLARMGDRVPISAGQASFQHAREAVIRELVELLVRLGRTEQALEVAREAHVRVLAAASSAVLLRQLDPLRREAWERAVTRYRELRERFEHASAGAWRWSAQERVERRPQQLELQRAVQDALDEAHALLQPAAAWRMAALTRSQPRVIEGELVLVYVPAESGLRAFAAVPGRVRTALIPVAPVAGAVQAGAELLEPFADELRAAQRVRILTHAELSALDVHALPFDGRPLLERLPVTYSLDLPLRSSEPPPTLRTLVVANPRGDLAATEREAQTVESSLALPRQSLLVRDAATRQPVLARLNEIDLFHYAGHARYSGLEGIDSHLVLADGALTLGDILNLSHAPARVVLSACEGAVSDARGYAGGFGLAQSFIAAGSAEVVAAARPVGDELARSFFELFYRELAERRDTALALQAAAMQLRARSPGADWAAFRLITR